MSTPTRRVFALVTGTMLLVAALGASLGVVFAGPRQPLQAGYNIVGGPFDQSVTAQHFTSCLGTAWNAVYIWDADAQEWRHHFRAVPESLNGVEVGGIETIPRLAGVVLIMDVPVDSPFLPNGPAEACPG